jgi:hypothetical protein
MHGGDGLFDEVGKWFVVCVRGVSSLVLKMKIIMSQGGKV